MNVHQLRVFLAVSDCMNISQVADRYFTSRQSIRYSIKSLEKDLGVSLVDVSNNKLVLTPNGAEVAEMARRALASYRQLQIDYVENVEASSHSIAVSVDSSLMTARDTIASFYFFCWTVALTESPFPRTPAKSAWRRLFLVNRMLRSRASTTIIF